MAVISSILGGLTAIGSALTGAAVAGSAAGAAAAATGGAVASAGTLAAIGGGAVALTGATVAGATTGLVTALSGNKKTTDAQKAPVYDAKKEQKQAELASAEAVKKRRLEQTQTVNTSALGATSQAQTGKTVLGG